MAARAANKISDTILFLEHSPVITLGRKQQAADNVLAAGDWPVVQVERGGDVTWHGPGQLVAYPIIRLEGERADLRAHLRNLEAAVIEVLRNLDLPADTDVRNSGVWLPASEGPPQKICSVGIACRNWVTWHGLALNINPDPSAFFRIRPCGFGGEVMTRLADHRPEISLDALIEPLAEALSKTLKVQVGPIAVQTISDIADQLRS